MILVQYMSPIARVVDICLCTIVSLLLVITLKTSVFQAHCLGDSQSAKETLIGPVEQRFVCWTPTSYDSPSSLVRENTDSETKFHYLPTKVPLSEFKEIHIGPDWKVFVLSRTSYDLRTWCNTSRNYVAEEHPSTEVSRPLSSFCTTICRLRSSFLLFALEISERWVTWTRNGAIF